MAACTDFSPPRPLDLSVTLWVPLAPLSSTFLCPQLQDMGRCYGMASLEWDLPLSAARKVASYTLFLV